LAWIDQHASTFTDREQAGLRWLKHRLEQRRSTALASLRRKEAKRLRRLTDFIEKEIQEFCLPADPTDSAHQPAATLAAVTGDLLGTLLHQFEPELDAIRSIEDRNQAHAARITGKRIRYLVEPLRKELSAGSDAVGQLKHLQDLLGDFNDANQFEDLVARVQDRVAARQERRFSKAVLKGKVLDEAWLSRMRERDPCPGLAALHERLDARRRECYARMEQWLREEAFALRRRLHDMVVALCRTQLPDREIERKYLLRSLPDLVVGSAAQLIEQGYLPGSQVRERLRRIRMTGTERYYRTIKVGDGIDRAEFEEETTREMFASMWPLTDGKRVRKRRYRVVFGELTWEIDEFLDHPLILAEVEIPHPSIDPEPPEWLRPYVVRQVSGEPEFLNVNLAR
jgi:CYTH domain-containing protein/CHAD domain-containing protein